MPKQCASPLPRAYQWADGSAYLSHAERLRKARGAEMPKAHRSDPLMYQGGSDAFLGPCDDILLESEDWGMDLEAEIAVITGDVPMGICRRKRRRVHPAADAGQRRVAAQSGAGGTRQGLRFFPEQALHPPFLRWR